MRKRNYETQMFGIKSTVPCLIVEEAEGKAISQVFRFFC